MQLWELCDGGKGRESPVQHRFSSAGLADSQRRGLEQRQVRGGFFRENRVGSRVRALVGIFLSFFLSFSVSFAASIVSAGLVAFALL